MKKTDTHTCGECLTGAGQMINVTCNYGNLKNVQEFVKDNIWSANFPTTRQSSTTHGSYGAYSRYQLKQHHYAGGGSGYVEVLEILDAPGERHNIVINMRYEEKTSFFEWETLEKATLTFEKYCQGCFHYKEFEKQDGFKRKINCYLLIPWFYAVGDEVLVGDYAFPTGLQDDPVFRFGEKFIYTDCEHNMSIKTCLGARVIEDYEEDYRGHGKLKIYRLVFFNDGSVWNEYKDPENMPQVITENDVWIDEAMQKFRNFLTGNTKEFEINLTNGQKFIGRWNLDKTKVYSLPGSYFLKIILEKTNKPVEGWVNDFEPSEDAPDVIKFAENEFAKKGRKMIRAEVTTIKYQGQDSTKKWSGVFFGKK